MSSKHTANYRLCQWEEDDAVRRIDFNENNLKIDGAIKGVDQRVDSLSAAVSGKASAAALNSLSATVSGQASTLNRKGNCQISLSTYTGTGGESNTITFSRRPAAVFVTGYGAQMFTVQGNSSVLSHGAGGSSANIAAAWSGNSVTFTFLSGQFDKTNAICNAANRTYYVIALFDLS